MSVCHTIQTNTVNVIYKLGIITNLAMIFLSLSKHILGHYLIDTLFNPLSISHPAFK